MCLVIVALDAHPRHSLVIAANRDEFHARAAIPARWGDTPPFADVLAGRDVAAGGTWLGVRRDGRWSLVTNVRDGGRPTDASAPSRGSLVPFVLNAQGSPAAALSALVDDAGAYNGFNLMAGDATRASWMSNRDSGIRALSAGVHGLSNATLDTPWPKLARTKDAVMAWTAGGDDDLSPLFAALASRTSAPDHALPSTGIPLEWERLLSAPFIVSADYGTRCSTVLAISRDGGARFIERTFDTRGDATGEVEFEFDVPR
jgi:uncharacterized protein with NRDE domain